MCEDLYLFLSAVIPKVRGSVVLIYLLASLLPWDMVVINKHLITDQFPEKKAKVLGGGTGLPPCPLGTDSPRARNWGMEGQLTGQWEAPAPNPSVRSTSTPCSAQ